MVMLMETSERSAPVEELRWSYMEEWEGRGNNTHVAAVALTPSTTHPHTQAELERSPVRGQEQEQPDVAPLPS